jgi:hypothetical protein
VRRVGDANGAKDDDDDDDDDDDGRGTISVVECARARDAYAGAPRGGGRAAGEARAHGVVDGGSGGDYGCGIVGGGDFGAASG